MKWNRYIFSATLLLLTVQAMAVQNVDSVYVQTVKESKYDKRIHRYQKYWAALIPTQVVIQKAGNMGLYSVGMGWDYGRHEQWETDLLVGYIPKHNSTRGKLTMTLKENYIPWSITLTPQSAYKKNGRWSLEPFTSSIYINTVFGHEFWKSQPSQYPDGYYQLLSTRFRLNMAFGQRVTFEIPNKKRSFSKSISFFYEVGTCDLYVRAMFQDSSVKLKNVLGLSIGMKLHTM